MAKPAHTMPSTRAEKLRGVPETGRVTKRQIPTTVCDIFAENPTIFSTWMINSLSRPSFQIPSRFIHHVRTML